MPASRQAAPWERKLLSTRQLLDQITRQPSIDGPAVRLACRGFDIARNADDQRARGELEIADVYRRMR